MTVFSNHKRKKNPVEPITIVYSPRKSSTFTKKDVAYHLYTALFLCSLGTQNFGNVYKFTSGSFMWRRSFQVEKNKLN